MDDSSRVRVGDQAVDDSAPAERGSVDREAQARGGADRAGASTSQPPAPPLTPSGKPAAYLGQAMKSLFESSDVSIRRDDETRVMSRAQDAIADLERRRGIVISTEPENASRVPSTPAPSRPPGPRVDVVLWVVLAVGLFAIAGWMLLYGL
jgi:hypothetical protein